MTDKSREENNLHFVFQLGLILKGVDGFLELVGSLLALLITKAFIIQAVLFLSEGELKEDPEDPVVHYLLHLARNLSLSSQYFLASYLLAHGVIKLFLAVGLFKNKLWVFPVAMVLFGIFIIYQLVRFASTRSIWFLGLTVFDVVILWLVWHEYGSLKESWDESVATLK